MKKIIFSVMTIAVVGALTVGATSAVFSSTATVENNTFATGTLEIRVNGQPTIAGFNYTNAAPGDCQVFQHNVNNYGQPWFAGPSTLDAKSLTVSALQDGGSNDLFDKLVVDVEANRGWPTWMPVYSGNLNALTNANLLSPRWTSLIPGSSEDVKYTVCLPLDADNTYQGLSTTFDFVVTGTNP
jgi:predicted ribosomally synthesized peptide with SipW-like signal peptide